MLLLAIRTIILYIVIMLSLKAMGKRQIGQLQPFELVVILVISEMASIAMESINVPILSSIIPIITLTVLQITIALLSLKSEKMRRTFCGTPSIVVKNGEIMETEMRFQRMNVNDLLEQIRAKGYFDLAEIEYAIMETNGQLSVMPRADKRPLQPSDIKLTIDHEKPAVTLVLDGQLNKKHLQEMGYNEEWLGKKLKAHNINNISDIFFASIDISGNLFCQLKEKDPQTGSPKPIRENKENNVKNGTPGAGTIPSKPNNKKQKKGDKK